MTKRKKFLPEKTVCENIPAEMAATAEEDILPAKENRDLIVSREMKIAIARQLTLMNDIRKDRSGGTECKNPV